MERVICSMPGSRDSFLNDSFSFETISIKILCPYKKPPVLSLLFYLHSKFIIMLVIEDFYIESTGYTEQELKIEIAIMLFEKEKLSLRKAATMAGLHWLNFMKELDKRKIALNYDESLL